MISEQVAQLKQNYPRRKGGQGWHDTERLIAKHLAAGHKFADILAGSIAYKDFCDREGLTGTEYVKQACTFFGRGCWWTEDYSEPAKPKLPAEIAKERKWQELHDRADRIGFRYPTSLEKLCDPAIYEDRLKQAERQSNVRAIR